MDYSDFEPRILETKAQTPEELAQELGVTMAEIPAILMQQMKIVNEALGDVTRRMQPQRPNRAQRRAAARGKAGAPRYKNGRPTY